MPAPTPPNIAGPFYRGPANGYDYAPSRLELWSPSASNEEVLVFHFMVRTTNNDVVGRYLIEIWQADGAGIYDCSNPRPPDAYEEFWPNTAFYRTARHISNGRLRGVWTVIPGGYFDSGLGFAREPHLHVIIRAAGHEVLTTQVFIPRAPNLPPSQDPYYQPQNTVQNFRKFGNVTIGSFVFYIE